MAGSLIGMLFWWRTIDLSFRRLSFLAIIYKETTECSGREASILTACAGGLGFSSVPVSNTRRAPNTMQRPSLSSQCTNDHITKLYIKPVLMKNHSFGASLLRIPHSDTDHHNCGHPQFFSFRPISFSSSSFFIPRYGIGASGSVVQWNRNSQANF